MISALLIIGSLGMTAPPGFLRATDGRMVSSMLTSGYVVMAQPQFDLDGDGSKERVVLVGRSDSDGINHAVGLLVCRKRKGRFSAAAWSLLPANNAFVYALSPNFVDLDGDGRLELALNENVAGGGFLLKGTSYWRFHNNRLTQVYYLTQRVRFAEFEERRTLKTNGVGQIVEVIERTKSGHRVGAVIETTMRWDSNLLAFAPDRLRVLR